MGFLVQTPRRVSRAVGITACRAARGRCSYWRTAPPRPGRAKRRHQRFWEPL